MAVSTRMEVSILARIYTTTVEMAHSWLEELVSHTLCVLKQNQSAIFSSNSQITVFNSHSQKDFSKHLKLSSMTKIWDMHKPSRTVWSGALQPGTDQTIIVVCSTIKCKMICLLVTELRTLTGQGTKELDISLVLIQKTITLSRW